MGKLSDSEIAGRAAKFHPTLGAMARKVKTKRGKNARAAMNYKGKR